MNQGQNSMSKANQIIVINDTLKPYVILHKRKKHA